MQYTGLASIQTYAVNAIQGAVVATSWPGTSFKSAPALGVMLLRVRAVISREKIKILYDKYLELIDLEIREFGVKPTEVRHLIGRLGEFYCALETNGALSHTVNQHGFDVVASTGRRISVKTTAQITGFVPISASTVDKADDVMILQYAEGALNIVYYGEISKATEAARFYDNVGKYELDISKARKLA